MICSRLLRAVCCSAFLAFAAQSLAANSVVWDESVTGDVSNDPTAPTQMNLVAGTNSFIATMPGADLDFFTVHVPAGAVLSAIYNPVYDSADQVSFIAIGPGTSMPAAVLNYDPTGLLGYTHFGPGVFDAGENLLTDLAIAQFGVPGFTPPLGAGAYSFWLQQESSVAEGYQLDFKVDAVPEPASAVLFLIGGIGAAFRRAKRLS
jgi:hypothetical protein